MKLKDLLKLAGTLAPILVPAAPVIVKGATAVIKSQKKGGSLAEELPTILAGVAAGKVALEAVKAAKKKGSN